MRNPFLAIFLLAATSLFSQTTNNLQNPTSVNEDGAPPVASAILDLNSDSLGMLVPRMTTAQRTAIASPATGLLVFDTDTGGFWFYNGTAWANLNAGAETDPEVGANTTNYLPKWDGSPPLPSKKTAPAIWGSTILIAMSRSTSGASMATYSP